MNLEPEYPYVEIVTPFYDPKGFGIVRDYYYHLTSEKKVFLGRRTFLWYAKISLKNNDGLSIDAEKVSGRVLTFEGDSFQEFWLNVDPDNVPNPSVERLDTDS